jgi:hypothetical protein
VAATLFWFSGVESGSLNEFSGNPSVGSPSVVTSPVRTGTYSLKAPSLSAASIKVNFGGAGSAKDVYVRLYFRVAALPSVRTRIWRTGNQVGGGDQLQVSLNTDGTVSFIYNGTVENTGADAISLGVWNLLELHFVRDTSVGGMEVFLNSVLQFTRFNLNTFTAGGTANNADFWFGPQDGGGQDMFFDDMAAAKSGYIGPGQCRAIQGKSGSPTYDAWVKNGAADSFGCWSQTPFDATKNCTSITTSDRQTMLVDDAAFNAAIPSGSVVNGAMTTMVAKCASSTINIKLLRRIGGTDTLSANKTLGTADAFVPGATGGNGAVLEVFTDTLANLASAEIGVEDENSSIQAQVEDMWLMVDFLPPAPPGTGALVLTGQTPTVSNPGGPTNTLITPDAGALILTGPLFVRVLNIGDLVLSWNVIERLSEILPLLWDVFGPGAVGTLPVSWSVRESITPLPVTWRVVPNLPALFLDVQAPVTTVVEIS